MSSVLLQVGDFADKHEKHFDKPTWIVSHLLLQETEQRQTDRSFPGDDLW